MSRLPNHRGDIERSYFDEGESYQQIADRYEVSREAVRQFLNRHFPSRIKGRQFRQQINDTARAEAKAQRERDAPRCVICYDPVTRGSASASGNRTCCPDHAELWSKARYLLDEGLRKKQRISTARSILKYRENHKPAEVTWAEKVVGGHPIRTTRSYAHKDSEARRAYEEVLRIRASKEKP